MGGVWGEVGRDLSMSARLNAWYWGNILFGGLIGWLIVDPATGAMWKLKDEFTLHLSPAGVPVNTGA